MNTILDDISAVIGFTATLKLVAWFSENHSTNVYVPAEAVEGQLLVKVVGMPAARRMSQEWPREHLNIPKLSNYEVALRRRSISRMLEKGVPPREIATAMDMSTRRVLQIREELQREGLLAGVDELLATAAPATVKKPPVAAVVRVPAAKAGQGKGAGTRRVVPTAYGRKPERI